MPPSLDPRSKGVSNHRGATRPGGTSVHDYNDSTTRPADGLFSDQPSRRPLVFEEDYDVSLLQATTSVHVGGVASCHCDHWYSGLVAAARSSGGTRGGPSDAMHQQSQAIGI